MRKSMPLRALFAIGLLFLSGLAAQSQPSQLERTLSLPGARVFFKDVTDGASVPSKVTLHFATENMELSPATAAKPTSGHHHLLIDTPLPPLDQPIPSDPNHLHLGRGQTEAEIVLPAGEHTLQLLMGDHNHIPHNPPVFSEPIHVKVDPATVETTRTPSPPGATAFFLGLDDDAKILAKSTIKFGVTGLVLAPAGVYNPNTGHHHLIIDSPLPDLDREIPSDPNHLHFGRGQTETELTLTPGRHTLQLLLGDHQHVPHDPAVMSKVIHVTVVDNAAGPGTLKDARTTGRTPSPPDAAVYFVYPTNGAVIFSHSTIRFGLRNMGVAPAGINKDNTGHHHLVIDAETPPLDKEIPNDPSHLHLGAGQTEKKITLKPGKHRLQLIFSDYRHVPHDPPVISEQIEVTVMGPRRRRGQ